MLVEWPNLPGSNSAAVAGPDGVGSGAPVGDGSPLVTEPEGVRPPADAPSDGPPSHADAVTSSSETAATLPNPRAPISLLLSPAAGEQGALAEAQVQARNDEQVKQRGGDQAAHDDHGHGVLDLVVGEVSGDHQWNQGQPERLALVPLQVLEVADHHDAVPRRDPQHGEEPHQ